MDIRRFHSICYFACLLVLVGSVYLQYGMGLSPCVLCWLQRGIVGSLALVLLVRIFHNPSHRWAYWCYAAALLFLPTMGGLLAGYHVWLQHQPVQAQAQCLPSLGYLWSHVSWLEFIHRLVEQHQGCVQVMWSFLHLSIPAWLLVFYGVLGVALVWGALRYRRALR